MNNTIKTVLGLSFLSVSLGVTVGYHHTHLREQRGKDIETLSDGALTYVPARLPFLDNGYLEGYATPREISCQLAQREYHLCTVTFVEFEEPTISLKVYAPIKEEKNVDSLIAVASSFPDSSHQMLEMLATAQKLERQVYIKARPELDASSAISLYSIFTGE